ncbi:hypothetical protein SAMN05660686_02626 [Thalassobaculum litoreum DSM 18839]|uniref:Uncharacterized protein n=3 Tax=Thalassobaculum TaxID=526215 RepID=A0A8G2BJS7_9PROT|nr:hypothetical protein SAMN05660686_02626 [Thalassobaculum litoreum DSM 18839]
MMAVRDNCGRAISALLRLAMLVGVLGGMPMGAAWAEELPSWTPVASEQLVRLPIGYLEKAVDRDFRDSSLADALQDKAAAIEGTAASLGAMQAAAATARGALRDEKRHAFLRAKQDYVSLLGARHDLERQQVETRLALYRRLLARIERTGDPGGPQAPAALAGQRAAAMERFAASQASVDMKLFASATAQESRYGREYRRQAAAIADLARAIDAHPMNAAPQIDGRAIGKPDYLAHLVAEAETDLALLDQKDLMLSYMAKLVALDAMALADEVDARSRDTAGRPELRDVSAAVDFFIAPN